MIWPQLRLGSSPLFLKKSRCVSRGTCSSDNVCTWSNRSGGASPSATKHSLKPSRNSRDVGLLNPAVLRPVMHGNVVPHALGGNAGAGQLVDAAKRPSVAKVIKLKPWNAPPNPALPPIAVQLGGGGIVFSRSSHISRRGSIPWGLTRNRQRQSCALDRQLAFVLDRQHLGGPVISGAEWEDLCRSATVGSQCPRATAPGWIGHHRFKQ